MEKKYEVKEVKSGFLRFKVDSCDNSPKPDFSSQINEFELLSKNLTKDNDSVPVSSSVEYFEPGILKAEIKIQEEPVLGKIEEEDSVKMINNWAELAGKFEVKLEEDFIDKNVQDIQAEEGESKDSGEKLTSEGTDKWKIHMKNFESFAKRLEDKHQKFVPNNRTCKYCGIEFPSYRLCFNHQKTIHEGVWHKCDLCAYVNARKDNIRIHKEKEHENVRYPCDKCDYKAKTKSHLKKHDEYIHQKLNFDCELCKFTCKSKSTLRYHVQMVHEGIGHQCPHCDYKARILSSLKSHISTVHEKVKDYHCDHCGHKTAFKSCLKAHMQVHEGATFKCDFCDTVCAQEASIQRHMKIKHKAK